MRGTSSFILFYRFPIQKEDLNMSITAAQAREMTQSAKDDWWDEDALHEYLVKKLPIAIDTIIESRAHKGFEATDITFDNASLRLVDLKSLQGYELFDEEAQEHALSSLPLNTISKEVSNLLISAETIERYRSLGYTADDVEPAKQGQALHLSWANDTQDEPDTEVAETGLTAEQASRESNIATATVEEELHDAVTQAIADLPRAIDHLISKATKAGRRSVELRISLFDRTLISLDCPYERSIVLLALGRKMSWVRHLSWERPYQLADEIQRALLGEDIRTRYENAGYKVSKRGFFTPCLVLSW